MLGDLSPSEITRIVQESFGRRAMPYLNDEQVQMRAAEIARRQGIFERIQRELAVGEPIPLLSYSGFREFSRTGNRVNYERLIHRRSGQIDLAAMAVYLGVEGAGTYLADLLWAECESSWWAMPSHEDHAGAIDLRVAMCGFQYAMICQLLPNRVPIEVRRRLMAEIRRRVLDEYLDPDRFFWWKTFTNNWNAVCNGGVGLTALLIETDPDRLAAVIRGVLENLPAFLSGFTADGGCTEGPSYWRYGFSWYVSFAAALYDFTGGRIDIMAGERIERICRYPLAMTIAPGQELMFADVHPGFLSPAAAIQINRFHDVPELFGLCRLTERGTLAVGALTDLLLVDESTCEPFAGRDDYHLPELGVVKLCCGPVTVGAKAGHNQEHHNHNDVGSFLVHRGRSFFLTDLGAPVYSGKTFSPRRYESIFCNSFGHGVPVVNGRGQEVGGQFAGSLALEAGKGGGKKAVRIEMGGAYDDASLKRLTRRIEIGPDGGELQLADDFAFAGRPTSVAEAFITTQPAEAAADGKSVTIRSEGDGSLELRSAGGGAFEVRELAEESAAESRSGELVRRIVFTPEAVAEKMTLQFVMRFH